MGELAAVEQKEFQDHGSLCPKCRRIFGALTQLQAELKARENALDEKELRGEELNELRKLAIEQIRELSGKKESAILRPLAIGAVALFVGLLLLFLGYFLLTRNYSSDQTLRGISPEEFRLIKPAGKLEEAPSVFLWTNIKGGQRFRFEIIDDELNILFKTTLFATRLELPPEETQKLIKGKVYLWTVEVCDENNNKLASASRYFEIE
jgi:hypothetical protein